MRRRKLEDYETQPEGIVRLGDGEAPAPKAMRVKSVSACASGRQAYSWLLTDVCVSRRGGKVTDTPQMKNPQSVSRFVHSIYPVANEMREVGLILVTDVRNRPMGLFEAGKGGLREMGVDLSVLLRGVLLLSGTGFFFFHNHPSGEPIPSQDDFALTQRIKQAADILKIKFLDHLILTANPDVYYSFVDGGSHLFRT